MEVTRHNDESYLHSYFTFLSNNNASLTFGIVILFHINLYSMHYGVIHIYLGTTIVMNKLQENRLLYEL